MAATLSDLLSDPIFTGASKDEQKFMIDDFAKRQVASNLEPTKIPNPLESAAQKQEAGDKEWEKSKKIMSAGLGLAGGGILGGALGTLFPSQTPGDFAAQALPLGKLSKLMPTAASSTSKIGLSGLLGLLGMQASGATKDAVDRGANALGGDNPVDPLHGISDPDKVFTKSANGTQLGVGMATLLPMLMQRMSNTVSRKPKIKQFDFMRDILGQTKGSQGQPVAPNSIPEMQNMPLMKPGETPGVPQMQAEGRVTPPSLQPTEGAISQAEAELAANQQQKAALAQQRNFQDNKNAGWDITKAQLEQEVSRLKIAKKQSVDAAAAKVQALRQQNADVNSPVMLRAQDELRRAQADTSKSNSSSLEAIEEEARKNLLAQQFNKLNTNAEILRSQEEKRLAGQTGQTDIDKAELQQGTANINQKVNKKTKVDIAGQTSALTERNKVLNNTLTELKEKSANEWEAMDPGLRDLVQNSNSPEVFIQQLSKAPSSAVRAYRDHVASMPNGTANVQALRDAMATDFFAKAYGNKTNPLGNADKLILPSNPNEEAAFDRRKIAAVFGDDKVQKFLDVANQVKLINSRQTPVGVMMSTAKSFVNHSLWVLPNALLYSSHLTHNPAASVVGASVSLAAIAYPKLVDILLNSPKLSDDFRKFATAPEGSAASALYNWPRLAAKIQEASVSVKPSDTTASPQTIEPKSWNLQQGQWQQQAPAQ